ncbi:integrase catalytic domain-containing protein [Trichonephila clavipes]|nr:integrase catalytic domain-containing protein [Trichonephila clavipes]
MLRARKHAYFFSCDISHTFRQIEIYPHQRHIQKILWEKGLNELVQIFKLKAVTYGTTPACYLSTRVLKQLSLDERGNFPKAADMVLHDVYLDDILSGCSSLNELESLKTELTQVFKSAGMSLHKWCFSHYTNNFPDLPFDQSCEKSITKTLGVLWNSSSDTFCFKVSPSTNHIFTKRDVLSQIARIFDPLGLLGPVISKAKFFMHQLWLLKLEWHEKLPVLVAAVWVSFVQSLPVLEKLKIPRSVLSENLESIILYGFSDASEKGFRAVTYVSVIKNNGDRHSQLLCSKSRVAPLKTLTIPSYFNDEHIEWNFIPPRSSNFGGLWESGVKSFKTHLKRVAGNSSLTLEEFITLLAEIEAVLNSRPLSPLSSDFDDFETLSPGHFLMGRPVTAIVEPQLINGSNVPFALKGRVKNEIDRLEREGIIEKVDRSEWTIPVVPVVKTDGSIRLCADYSVTLNPNLIVPQHPLPRLEEIFGSLNEGKQFTKLDFKHAYLQMKVHPDSQKLMTINTHK